VLSGDRLVFWVLLERIVGGYFADSGADILGGAYPQEPTAEANSAALWGI